MTNWLHRIMNKIDQQFNENITVATADKTIMYKFKKVMQAVTKQLEQILMEEEEEERQNINTRDFMHDYASQEFLDKNIRVRPTSGLLRGGDDDAKTQDGGIGASRQDAFGNNIDDEEQYNKGVAFELKNEREMVKKRFEDYAAQKRAEEERARRRRL